MWNPPESVHVCRGRIRGRQLCELCFTYIEEGQRYSRRIWRPPGAGRRWLEAFYEHVNAHDCPQEEREHELEELQTEPVSVGLALVFKQVVVIALDVAGKPFVDTKSILTVEAVTEAEDPYPDDDEYIPF